MARMRPEKGCSIIEATATSHLVRGLIAISIYSDRTVREILSSDAQAFFRELGLEQHLTPQRSNGVRAMIERIRADAAASRSALFPRSASPDPGARFRAF